MFTGLIQDIGNLRLQGNSLKVEGCDSFKIAGDIDKEYKAAFDKALKCGVKILCYNCKLSNEEIKLNNKIDYDKWL